VLSATNTEFYNYVRGVFCVSTMISLIAKRHQKSVRPMTAGRHRPPQDTISSNIVGIFTVSIV